MTTRQRGHTAPNQPAPPNPPSGGSSAKPASRPPEGLRDQIAFQVLTICMHDLSRDMSTGGVKLNDSERAVKFIAALAYFAADAMIEARDRK